MDVNLILAEGPSQTCIEGVGEALQALAVTGGPALAKVGSRDIDYSLVEIG
jgi:hypothetical protein